MPKPTLYTVGESILAPTPRPRGFRHVVGAMQPPSEGAMRLWDGAAWRPLDVVTTPVPEPEVISSVRLDVKGGVRYRQAASLAASASLSAVPSVDYAGAKVVQYGNVPPINPAPLTINLPSNLTTGNLLVAIVGSGGGAVETVAAGWTRIFLTHFTEWYSRMSVFTKTVEASDNGASVVMTSSNHPMVATWFEIASPTGTPIVEGYNAPGERDYSLPFEMWPMSTLGLGRLAIVASLITEGSNAGGLTFNWSVSSGWQLVSPASGFEQWIGVAIRPLNHPHAASASGSFSVSGQARTEGVSLTMVLSDPTP